MYAILFRDNADLTFQAVYADSLREAFSMLAAARSHWDVAVFRSYQS